MVDPHQYINQAIGESSLLCEQPVETLVGLSFRSLILGIGGSMAGPNVKTWPQPGEIWLSRPPYLFLAHIVEVNDRSDPAVVSYVLHDEDGFVLERVSHTVLDRDWWHAFQPMDRAYG
jgi:hypothetical protein